MLKTKTKNTIPLDSGWILRCKNHEKDIVVNDVNVPCSVFAILEENEIIPNPFFGLNEYKMDWVYNSDWELVYRFEVKQDDGGDSDNFHNFPRLLDCSGIYLKFFGVDTFGTVSLNDTELFKASDMFCDYLVSVPKELIKINDVNELKVLLKSPVKEASKRIKDYGIKLSTGSYAIPGVPYIRKAQYSFGWDWGPKLPDIGIWKEVFLIGSDIPLLKDVIVKQEFSNNFEEVNIYFYPIFEDVSITRDKINNIKHFQKVLDDYRASISISFKDPVTDEIYNQEVSLNHNNAFTIERILPKEDTCGEYNTNSTETFHSLYKISSEHFKIHINNPSLWWSSDLIYSFEGSKQSNRQNNTQNQGVYENKPVLYNLKVQLTGFQGFQGKNSADSNDNVILDEIERKIGIRDIKLIRKKDKWGESFYFQLNGVPVWAKGANWIPIDSFIPRGRKLDLYRRNLEAAAKANMNMIRVWGGGIYETDEFYELCDELGILVWQDFPFACAVYPPENDFFAQIKYEAIQNIIRIQHHAALALWCGNNEIEQGYPWYSRSVIKFSDRRRFKKGYIKLFERILPSLVSDYDGTRSYWPSSPSNGGFSKKGVKSGIIKSNSPDFGDSHFWKVWHGGAPFSEYKKFDSRFMSEFGFESFPSMSTLRTICPKDVSLNDKSVYSFSSKIMESHQKNSAGNGKILSYMKKRFSIPDSFENQVILSQITHAEAMEYGIEHWRRNRNEFHCMGSLYWQLNDCWPVASWSSLDYYIRWKALHYFAKRFYKPVYLSVNESINEKRIEIWLTNDGNRKGGINFLKEFGENNMNQKKHLQIEENQLRLKWCLYGIEKTDTSSISEINEQYKIINEGMEKIQLPEFSSAHLKTIDFSSIIKKKADLRRIIFLYKLIHQSDHNNNKENGESRILQSNIKLFTDPKDFALPETKVKIEDIRALSYSDYSVTNWDGSFIVSADNIALYVNFTDVIRMKFDTDLFEGEYEIDLLYSDNFFHLEPNEKREILFKIVRINKPMPSNPSNNYINMRDGLKEKLMEKLTKIQSNSEVRIEKISEIFQVRSLFDIIN